MDFITSLPKSERCIVLLVVTNRLSKDIVLILLLNMDIETIAWAFIKYIVAYH